MESITFTCSFNIPTHHPFPHDNQTQISSFIINLVCTPPFVAAFIVLHNMFILQYYFLIYYNSPSLFLCSSFSLSSILTLPLTHPDSPPWKFTTTPEEPIPTPLPTPCDGEKSEGLTLCGRISPSCFLISPMAPPRGYSMASVATPSPAGLWPSWALPAPENPPFLILLQVLFLSLSTDLYACIFFRTRNFSKGTRTLSSVLKFVWM